MRNGFKGDFLMVEYHFTLPRGYLDSAGDVHRDGRMRLATALDEIESLQDSRVQIHQANLPLVLLSRVVTCLDGLPDITVPVIAGLYAGDLAFLEDLYLLLNSPQPMQIGAICPHCGRSFHIPIAPVT
jgi:hypothetical protein